MLHASKTLADQHQIDPPSGDWLMKPLWIHPQQRDVVLRLDASLNHFFFHLGQFFKKRCLSDTMHPRDLQVHSQQSVDIFQDSDEGQFPAPKPGPKNQEYCNSNNGSPHYGIKAFIQHLRFSFSHHGRFLSQTAEPEAAS